MSDGPKAIETRFDGHWFRSRLEARWAVFFKWAGVRYQYEPEGYDLGDGIRYLADFWLPNQHCFLEVKGQQPTEFEHEKAYRLSKQAGCRVFLFAGPILVPDIDPQPSMAYGYTLGIPEEAEHCWTQCPFCHALDFDRFGAPFDCAACEWAWELRRVTAGYHSELQVLRDLLPQAFLPDWTMERASREVERSITVMHNSPLLVAAFLAARQARFEGPYQQRI